MNVLVLHSELGVLRGGGENFTRNLFAAFAERGHRVTAAFAADARRGYPLPLPSGIRAFPIPGWWSRNWGQAILSSIGGYLPSDGPLRRNWDRVLEALAWRSFAWHRRRFQRRVEREFAGHWREFDAVYVHGISNLASEVARHCITVLRLPGPVAADVAAELRRVHAVCANGDALVQIRTFLGDDILELPVGIDHRLFTSEGPNRRSHLGWPDNVCVVGYVGRLTHLKGVDLLAAAFRDLSASGSDVRLLIVGHGEEHKSIRAFLARELERGLAHIEPGVDHEQLPEWYRAMDLIVMPSRYENHSNAILEAMACAVPFLGSDVGGNRNMAATGAGWLFQSGSVRSLQESLRNIIADQTQLKARREHAFSSVRNHRTWAASAERLEHIISSRLTART